MRVKCFFLGHEITRGSACPVTGIIRLDCKNCDASNMPKHTDNGMSFT